MEIKISGHETILTDEVKNYAQEKMNKLGKYNVDILVVDLVLEENHNKTESTAAVAKVFIKMAGKDIEAHGEGKNIFVAVDVVEQRASQQLRKHKEKTTGRVKFKRSKAVIRKIFRREG